METSKSISSRVHSMGKGPEVWYKAGCEDRMKVPWL